MPAKRKKGNIFMAGLAIESLTLTMAERQPGQYTIAQLQSDRLEVLEDTFGDPEVVREYVTKAPTVKVICRFIYDDEDEQLVRSTWSDRRIIKKPIISERLFNNIKTNSLVRNKNKFIFNLSNKK